MRFGLIDKKLFTWVEERNLHIYTNCRDGEVRSIDVISRNGKKCQIWIEPANNIETFVITVWDYNKRKRIIKSNSDNFINQIEVAYETAVD